MPKSPIARAAAKEKKPMARLMRRSLRTDIKTGETVLVGDKPTTAREKAMYAQLKPQARLEKTLVSETIPTPGRGAGSKAVSLVRKKKP